MKDFSKDHRKGRCKTPQTKWISVNPFELFRDKHLNNSDSEVRVLTNPEIEDFRNKGYSVDIVERILPKCTRKYPYKGSGMSIKVVRELNKKSRKQELLERHVVVIRKIGELMKEVDDLFKKSATSVSIARTLLIISDIKADRCCPEQLYLSAYLPVHLPAYLPVIRAWQPTRLGARRGSARRFRTCGDAYPAGWAAFARTKSGCSPSARHPPYAL